MSMALWIRRILSAPLLKPRLSLAFSSSPTSDQTPPDEALISSVVYVLTEHRSKSRWSYLKSLIHPNVLIPAEVSQITLRVRNNPHLALRFFLWSQENSLFAPDLISYSTMIHILARSRLKTRAQDLIRTAIRISESDGADPSIFRTLVKTYRSCDSAPFVFDLLIRAYLNSNKIYRAVEIVRLLRSRGIHPLTGTCNSIIRSVAELRGSDTGFAMYQEIFRSENKASIRVSVLPNVQTFNTLMLSFYRDQNIEQMDEILNEMVKFGCDPNVFTYSILMAASCGRGKIDEAIRLWDKMRINEIKPDVMAYNTLLSGFCDIGKIKRAEALFREMGLDGIEATCVSYECLIKGYCKIGDVDSAIVLYRDMCRRGFGPEAATVNEVIGEMCRTKRVSEGLEFLRNVMKRVGFYPNRASYKFLIEGLCEEGKMEEACKVQVEMVGKGFELDAEIYGSFIEGYREQGDMEKVGKLTNEMVHGQREFFSKAP